MAQKARRIGNLALYTFIVATVFNLVGSWFEWHRVTFRSPIVIEAKLVSPIPTIEITPTPTATPSATRGVEIVKPVVAKEPERAIEGEASYYSREGCIGCSENLTMANGQPLDDTALTLALTPEMVNKYKLLNDYVEVENLANGKTVRARVTDTGGFGKLGRVADLSVATKNAINCKSLCQVKITY